MDIQDFLANFDEDDFPKTISRWFTEDDFDPPFLRGELRMMERKKLIIVARTDPKKWRFALTLSASAAREIDIERAS
jgi:acetoacetate decarboxylase